MGRGPLSEGGARMTVKVRINLANPLELMELPGLSHEQAMTIVKFRAEHGPTRSGSPRASDALRLRTPTPAARTASRPTRSTLARRERGLPWRGMDETRSRDVERGPHGTATEPSRDGPCAREPRGRAIPGHGRPRLRLRRLRRPLLHPVARGFEPLLERVDLRAP